MRVRPCLSGLPCLLIFGLAVAGPPRAEWPAASAAAKPVPRSCVAAGGGFFAAVTADGAVWVWGDNSSGALGRAYGTDDEHGGRAQPARVPDVANAVSVAAGTGHILVLLENGSAVAWGDGGSGQLGMGAAGRVMDPTEIDLSDIVAVAAGGDMSYAIRSDGTLWGWGNGGRGRLGDGTLIPDGTAGAIRKRPVRVKGIAAAVAVATEGGQSIALDTAGAVWAWQARLGSGGPRPPIPERLGDIRGAVAVGAGSAHRLIVLGDGSVVGWGGNAIGQLGFSPLQFDSIPLPVALPLGRTKFRGVVGDHHRSFFLGDAEAFAIGDNNHGALGTGPGGSEPPAGPRPLPGLREPIALAAEANAAIALQADGAVLTWGAGLNDDAHPVPVPVAGLPRNFHPACDTRAPASDAGGTRP